jgi:hypothetical protein
MHTMDCPDWIWMFFQDRYEIKNPASRIREELGNLVRALQNEEKEPIAKSLGAKPSFPPRPSDSSLSQIDIGTPITIARPGPCNTCGTYYPAGTDMMICEKRLYCEKCLPKKDKLRLSKYAEWRHCQAAC